MTATKEQVEIITIGREILDGRVVDTNSVFIAQFLKQLGLVVRHAQRVDDDLLRIVEAFKLAASRSDVVLVTGGLGPTADDLSAEAFALYLNEKPVLNPEALKLVQQAFERIKRPMTEVQKKQALLAPSVRLLKNSKGTAPGFYLKQPQTEWYFFPGVPGEMKAMLENEVRPLLPANSFYRTKSWATQFTSEGQLQERLEPVHQKLIENFELTYRTRFPENHIGLHAHCPSPSHERLFEELDSLIGSILGDDVYASGESDAFALEKVVIELAQKNNVALTSVESCTGGLIAQRLCSVSGASQVFLQGFVPYHNKAKIRLGVSEDVIHSEGAVSSEVALALAELGVQETKKLADQRIICVSTTGIAGPTGGSPAKPVGLCFAGLAEICNGKLVHSEVLRIDGRPGLEREDYQKLFSQKALDLIRKRLLKE